MAKEVRIKLTDAQRSKIKSATGKNMTEIRVTSLGGSTKAVSARASRMIAERASRVGSVDAVSARASRVTSQRSSRAGAEVDSVSARTLRDSGGDAG